MYLLDGPQWPYDTPTKLVIFGSAIRKMFTGLNGILEATKFGVRTIGESDVFELRADPFRTYWTIQRTAA